MAASKPLPYPFRFLREPQPPIAGEADIEYESRIQAAQCTWEFSAKLAKPLDCGKEPIEHSPLFGGNPQGELF